jgi:outer membrane protein assembly factor BamB
MRAACLVAALIASSLTVVSAADIWPHFRGATGGVVADDPMLPEAWDTKENVAWKVRVPGLGWGSPIVWGDHVFVTAAVGNDPIPKPGLVIEDDRMPSTPTYWQIPPNATYRWMLYAFDFQTGKLRWERELRHGAPVTPRYHKNSLATETSVTDGQRVYVFHAPAGLLAAVDFNGQIVWTRSIEQPVLGQADVGPFGPAASPAIHGNRIFIVSDEHPTTWWLAAFDTNSGKQLWRIEEPKQRSFGWSTPFVWEQGGRTELITVSRGRVSSYDLDGNALWHLNGLSGSTTPTPFAANGLLYASSGYPAGPFRPVYAIRPGARGDITPKDGETSNDYVVWSNPTLATYLPSPIVYRGQLCSLFARGFFTCHDAASGKEIYGRQRIDPQASGFSVSPWAYNGRIFVASEDGDVYVIDAGPEFRIVRKNSMGEMISIGSPAIVRSSLIIRTVSSLWKIATPAAGAAR